jgi:deoxyhypusine synthase
MKISPGAEELGYDHLSKAVGELSSEGTTLGVDDRSISELAMDMSRLGFQAGKLGESLNAWRRMLDEEITIFLGLAGAMIPAGLQEVIAYLISERMVDCVVSTGANVFHDLSEGLGVTHYRGSSSADDALLREKRIDRIFNVYVADAGLVKADRYIAKFVKTLREDYSYSSREIMELLGKSQPEKTILGSAYQSGVPIFVPALCDSSIGIGMVLARRAGHKVLVDQIKDADEITQITEQSSKTGVIYIGGGVPKNFIQQTKVIEDLLGNYRGGHEYAIQYTTDAPHFGGLSGCTFSEAVSWGKVSKDAKMVQVFVDATIALPFVVHALRELENPRKVMPSFSWTEKGLDLQYVAED